ncbi:MAG: DUF3500 domain-containing protein [Planctomycetota bacterium]
MKSFLSVALVLVLSALCVEPAQDKNRRARAEAMSTAARAWLDALPAELVGRAQLPFDDPSRADWDYTERARGGVALGELTGEQRTLFDRMLREALSMQGYLKAHGVLALAEVQGKDPQNFFATVFGEPSGDAPWAWRFEGEGLSLNFTVHRDDLFTATPMYFGARPAEVPDGLRAGFKLFYEEERLARELIASFNETQRRFALHLPDAPPEDNEDESYGVPPSRLHLVPGRTENFEARKGLSPRSMTFNQRFLFMRLLNLHVANVHQDLTSPIMNRYRDHDIFDHTFLWVGSEEPGQPFYYRIHSEKKDFAIEFLNPDGHEARVLWRDFNTDLGGTPLREHFERATESDGFFVEEGADTDGAGDEKR